MLHKYEKNGAAIYKKSFRIIREESKLDHFSVDEEPVAVRMIHAAGMVELAKYIHFSSGFVQSARAALANGAPIFCDAKMVLSKFICLLSNYLCLDRFPVQIYCVINCILSKFDV